MTQNGQSLGQVKLTQVRADQQAVVQDSELVSAEVYSALGEHKLVVKPAVDFEDMLSKLSDATRLVIIDAQHDNQGARRFCRHVRSRVRGWSVVILAMSRQFSDRLVANKHQSAWQVDLCLPPSAPKQLLAERIGVALIERQPMSKVPYLPKKVRESLDELWDRAHLGNYYDLFEVSPSVAVTAIQSAFHQLADFAHPDRHPILAERDENAANRISAIFKRLSEAHHVLTHPIRRRTYDLCLKSRGSLRYEPEALDAEVRAEIESCQTEPGRLAVLDSLMSRLEGEWRAAAQSMVRATESEPDNEWLKERTESVKRIWMLATHGSLQSEGRS